MSKLHKITSLLFFCDVVRKNVDFLHTDNMKVYENFLQMGTMIFSGDGQAFPKFPKHQVYNVFTISQKKKLEMKLIF